MKILVVDDHVLIREALRGVLRELKGETTVILEASDSREAVRELEQHGDVELVLLDLNLPDRDGLDVLQELVHAGRPCLFVLRIPCARESVEGARSRRRRLHSQVGTARSHVQRVQLGVRGWHLRAARDPRAAFRPMPLRHLRRVQI